MRVVPVEPAVARDDHALAELHVAVRLDVVEGLFDHLLEQRRRVADLFAEDLHRKGPVGAGVRRYYDLVVPAGGVAILVGPVRRAGRAAHAAAVYQDVVDDVLWAVLAYRNVPLALRDGQPRDALAYAAVAGHAEPAGGHPYEHPFDLAVLCPRGRAVDGDRLEYLVAEDERAPLLAHVQLVDPAE